MLDTRSTPQSIASPRPRPRPAPAPRRPGLAERIAAATPPDRDRAVDALRALAILGVVLGHWLVTALVEYGDGRLRVASPLQAMPWLAPISWALQTLSVFFLVGGYTAAKGYRPGAGAGAYRGWLRARLTRLARPVPALLAAWVPLTAALWYAGFSGDSLHTLLKLVFSPLWFLGVYAALTALTPVVVAAWRRIGWYAVALPIAVTALVDLGRFGLGRPEQLGWLNVLAGWLVPYALGVAWAHGASFNRRTAAALLAGGAAGTALLVGFGGYPASMVGVPGAAISNLNPPTLATVTFAIAQVGLVFLMKDRLGRWMRRPRLWAAVALANLSAMTIFLWHQTSMMLVTLAALFLGAQPGLHTVPRDLGWVPDRLAWLPVFAAALAGCRALFARFEGPRRRATPNASSAAGVVQAGKKVP